MSEAKVPLQLQHVPALPNRVVSYSIFSAQDLKRTVRDMNVKFDTYSAWYMYLDHIFIAKCYFCGKMHSIGYRMA